MDDVEIKNNSQVKNAIICSKAVIGERNKVNSGCIFGFGVVS